MKINQTVIEDLLKKKEAKLTTGLQQQQKQQQKQLQKQPQQQPQQPQQQPQLQPQDLSRTFSDF